MRVKDSINSGGQSISAESVLTKDDRFRLMASADLLSSSEENSRGIRSSKVEPANRRKLARIRLRKTELEGKGSNQKHASLLKGRSYLRRRM